MKSMGSYIKACRIARGFTQEELGILCGYTPGSANKTVYTWEHDMQKVPLDRLRKLSKALQVPLDSLIP